jgi:hypothetical protein
LAGGSGGQYNLALGVSALAGNSAGSFNTAVGPGSLDSNINGSGNTAVGYGALDMNSGNGNIALGYLAGSQIGFGGNNIEVGTVGSDDNGTIRIGTLGTQTSAFIAGISGVNVSGVPVLVSSSGQLGVASSSRRYKEEIQSMGDATNGLMKLRPVTFRYKKAFEDGSKPLQFGLIAEEVAEVYPDLVARSADGQIETVRYQLLDSMLLNELQKQNATVTAQKEQIGTQAEQIRSLQERLARVEAALSGNTAPR